VGSTRNLEKSFEVENLERKMSLGVVMVGLRKDQGNL